MSFLGTGFAAASGSYSITNSIRLNGTSDYLSKTLTTSSTTSGSVWVKRSKLGATSPIFDNKVYFTSGDALYAFGLTSTALYRDPSAWMHIFWNGTGVYVNGTLVTGSGTYTAASVTNPRLGYDGTNYFSGSLSDFAFWNGTSASLQGGATNADGVWAAKRPSAGYSFLEFQASGNLGDDTSGNANDWTVNSSPVQTTDTPTSNSCTLNPLEPGSGTHSNGNLSISLSSYNYQGFGSFQMTSGKWYWEVSSTGSTQVMAGICDPRVARGSDPWSSAYIWGYRDDNGNIRHNGTNTAYGNSYTTEVIGVAYDADNGKLYFSKSGTWQNSAVPASGTGGFTTDIVAGTGYLPWFGSQVNVTRSWSVNFGATAFAHTPPTGFKSLNTANLASAAVTTSGTFTGNANADGPFVWTNGNPATLTINGNAVTFGTHADKTAGGFKLRSSSASYNTSGSNTWTATAGKRLVYSATSINTAQGNP
jgi:hypothetical protein